MKKRYLLLILLSVFLFLPKTTLAATQNAKQHFRITPNDYDYTTVDSLGTFNMDKSVLFVEYIVSFTDVSIEKNKTYHAVFNYYGGISDGFYSFDSTIWSFLTDDNKTIPIYNLSMTSTGNSRNVEFDFYIPYDEKNFQLKIYNKELPVLYYSWSSSSQFGCTSVAINKIADNTDSLIKQNDIIIGQNKDRFEEQKKTNEKLDKAEETRKGIWETIKSLPSLIIDKLLGLFVPDDTDFIDNFVESIENKLGFIATIPIQFIDFLLGLANATWEEVTSINFPAISIFGYNFWNAQEIDLTEAINIFKPFKYVTDVIAVTLFCNTLLKWWQNFTGGNN